MNSFASADSDFVLPAPIFFDVHGPDLVTGHPERIWLLLIGLTFGLEITTAKPMIRRVIHAFVTIVPLLVLTTLVHAAQPTVDMLSAACDGCHGAAGHSAGPSMPSLAGQSREYFTLSMLRFRSGERPSTVMGRLAHGYADAEIKAMAGYYARQKPAPQTAPLNDGLVKRGLTIYYKQCKTCHLDGELWVQIHQYRAYERECNKSCHLDYGPENNADTPLIGGQWAEYLETQLAAFKDGTRKMSPRKAKALQQLTQEDLRAVAAFYASLKDLKR